MDKIKSNILTGLVIGFIANVIGMLLYVLIFVSGDLNDVYYKIDQFNLAGKIIALGAAANFLPFFILLNKNKIYMARGVVIAMIISALITLFYNLNIWFN